MAGCIVSEERLFGVKNESQAEIRLLFLVVLTSVLLGTLFLWAGDYDADLLDDSFESQHGLSTNAVAANHLLGWWQLDETNGTSVADRSTNNLALTVVNAGTNDWQSGAFNSSVVLDGASRYLQAQTNAVYDLTDFTFSAWVNTGTNTTLPQVLAQWQNTATNGWQFDVTAEGRARVWFDTPGNPDQVLVSTNTPIYRIDDEVWHHVALSFASTNTYAKLYIDGQLEAEGAVAGTMGASVENFTLGRPGTTNSTYWAGQIDEVRLYNKVLSATEVAQLPETYSDTDGDGLNTLEEQTAGTDPNDSDSDNDGLGDGIDPLPTDATNGAVVSNGLQLWLRGDFVDKDGSDKVSRWYDLSGNGNHADQGTAANQPTWTDSAVNSMPTITFDGNDDYMRMPAGFADLASGGMAVFIVTKPTASKRWARFFDFGNGSGSNNIFFSRENTTDTLFFRVLSGSTGVREVKQGGGILNDQYSIYGYQHNGVDRHELRRGGETLKEEADSGFVGNVTRSNNYIAKSNWADEYFQGEMTEILIYNRALTETEIIEVEAYLAARYGVTYEPPAPEFNPTQDAIYQSAQNVTLTHAAPGAEIRYTLDGSEPTASSTLYTAPIAVSATTTIKAKVFSGGFESDTWEATYVIDPATSIIPTADMQIWLRADIAASDENGLVSSWLDLSGNGHSADQGNSSYQPQVINGSINGHPVLRFDGLDPIDIQGNLGTSPVTVFAVFNKPSSGGGSYQRMFSSSPSNKTDYQNNGVYLVPPTANSGVATTAGPQLHVQSHASKNMSNFFIGRHNQGSYFYYGDLAEFLVFDAQLNQEDQTRVEVYLSQRYGLAYTMPAPAVDLSPYAIYSSAQDIGLSSVLPGAEIRYTIDGTEPTASSTLYTVPISIGATTTVKAKAFYEGLESETLEATYIIDPSINALPFSSMNVWFRSDVGVKLVDTDQVASWADLSGNDFHATNVMTEKADFAANQLNGHPAIQFRSTSKSPSAGSGLKTPNLGTGARTIYLVGRQTMIKGADHWQAWITTQGAGGSGEPSSAGLTVNGQQNGAFIYTNPSENLSFFPTSSPPVGQAFMLGYEDSAVTWNRPLYIGRWFPAQSNWNSSLHGDIFEILIFDGILSTSERLAVDNYLAARYGIEVGPEPEIEVGSHLLSPSDLITLTSPEAGVDLYYTLDGSDPTTSSTLYTGPFSLTASATLKVRAFRNANVYSPVVSQEVYVDSAVTDVSKDGLALWLRADAGVTKDGSDYVSEWRDLSGNDHIAAQANGSQQPLWHSSGLGSQPALEFDGSADSLLASTVALGPEVTVLAVASTDTLTGGHHRVINNEGNLYLGNRNGEFASFYGNHSSWGTTASHGSDGSYVVGQAHVLSSVNDSLDTAYFDGTEVGRRYNPMTAFTDGMRVGRNHGSANQYWDGKISEILVYDHALSREELHKAHLYLGGRYGISIPVPMPDFDQAGGLLAGTTNITLSNIEDGVEIYYTIDGTEATNASTLYTGPVAISADTTLKARAYRDGSTYSEVAEAAFTIDASTINVPRNEIHLWLRGDVGLEDDGNARAETWLDQSGQTRHAEQTNSAKRPVIVADSINGEIGIKLDGGNDYLDLGQAMDFERDQALSILVVVKPDSSGGNGSILGKLQNNSPHRGHDFLLYLNATDEIKSHLVGSWSSSALAAEFDGTYANQFHVINLNYDGSQSLAGLDLQLDGVARSPSSTLANGPSATTRHGGIASIGSRNGISNFFKGEIAEILVYERELTSQEKADVQAYLESRYGIEDTDGDGLVDYVENAIIAADPDDTLTSLADVLPTGDFDDDGTTNLAEYQNGTDPADYYNGVASTLTKISGDNQIGPEVTFASQPLSVKVTQTSGGAALVNAPVTFTVNSGGIALLAEEAAEDAASSDTLTVRTDANGEASVYLTFGLRTPTDSENYITNTVTVENNTASDVQFAAITAEANSPPQLDDMVMWVSADYGYILDSLWKDRSYRVDEATNSLVNNDNHLITFQYEGPTLRSTVIDGKTIQYLDFRAGSKHIVSGNLQNVADDLYQVEEWTFAYVLRRSDRTDYNQIMTMANLSDDWENGLWHLKMHPDGAFNIRGLGTVGGGYDDGEFHVLIVKRDANGEMNVSVDGELLAKDDDDIPDWDSSIFNIVFGHKAPAGYSTDWQDYRGDIGELVFYDAGLSSASEWELTRYLGERFLIPIELPQPEFDQQSHVSSDTIEVTIASPASEGQIYFTQGTESDLAEPALDGNGDPVAGTTLYTEPIELSASATIKAKVFAPDTDYNPSQTVTRTFVVDPASHNIPRSNLKLWMRADHGVETNSGKVSAWQDVSGEGHVALQADTNRQPSLTASDTALNDMPAVSLDGTDDYLDIPDNYLDRLKDNAFDFGTGDFTVFVVGKTDSHTNFPRFLGKGAGGGTNGFALYLDNANGKMRGHLHDSSGTATFATSPVVSDDVARLMVVEWDRDGNMSGLSNGDAIGTLDISILSATDLSNAHPLRIGSSSISGGRPLDGELAEVLIYDRVLSANERFEVEKYLAQKYDLYPAQSSPVVASPAGGTFATTQSVTLTSPTPGASIYYTTDGTDPTPSSTLYTGAISVSATTTLKAIAVESGTPASTITTEIFTIEPSLDLPLTSLELWLRADRGTVTDGNDQLLEWKDQSGNGRHATQAVGTLQPGVLSNWLNGSAVVDFDGDNDSLGIVGDFKTFTAGAAVVAVVAFDATDRDHTLLELGNNTPSEAFSLGYDATAPEILWQTPTSGSSSLLSTGTHVSATKYHLLHAQLDDANNLALYRDGVLTATVGGAAIPDVSRVAHYLGVTSAGQQRLDGKVAELFIYSDDLIDADRRKLEDYLQTKYGLTIELAAPSVSPLPGTYSSAQTISITATNPPAGAEIRYTLDGSTPTASSTLYSGTFSLSEPRTVKARVFADGYAPSSVASATYVIGDADDDGLLDTFEQSIIDADTGDGITTTAHVLPEDDFDGDGLTNLEEYLLGSDPTSNDSNGDGLSDQQLALIGHNPASTDYDGDGVTNLDEAAAGTDPFLTDTDGDGVNDNADDFPLDPNKSTGDPGSTAAPVINLTKPASATPVP